MGVRERLNRLWRNPLQEALQVMYPFVPKPDVRKFLAQHNHHYAPTVLFLRRQAELPPNQRSYAEKRTKYKVCL